jgi:hypothetical protein
MSADKCRSIGTGNRLSIGWNPRLLPFFNVNEHRMLRFGGVV